MQALTCDSVGAETAVLAGALKDEGFTIIASCPGWVETDMGTRSSRETDVRRSALSPALLSSAQHVCCEPSGKASSCGHNSGLCLCHAFKLGSCPQVHALAVAAQAAYSLTASKPLRACSLCCFLHCLHTCCPTEALRSFHGSESGHVRFCVCGDANGMHWVSFFF